MSVKTPATTNWGRGQKWGVVLALILVAAACGTKSETATTAAPPPPPATTAPPTTQDKNADEKIARNALLTADDLPGQNWKDGKARDASSNNDLFDGCPKLADQVTEVRRLTDSAPQAKSPQILNAKTNVEVDDDVTILATEDDATTVANVLGDQAFVDCFRAYLEKQAAKDASGIDANSIRLERMKVGKLGDDHSVFSIRLDLTGKSSGTTLHLAAAFIRNGRGYTNVSYTSTTEPDVAKDVMPIFEAANDKLKKKLAS